MTTIKEDVKNEVFKINAFDDEALKIRTEAIKILEEYKGKSVTKTDGALFKAVKEKLDKLMLDKVVKHYDGINKATLRTWLRSNEYNIWVNAQFCYYEGEGCVYDDQSIYICNIKDHVVESYITHDIKSASFEFEWENFKEAQKHLNEALKAKEKLNYRVAQKLNERWILEIGD